MKLPIAETLFVAIILTASVGLARNWPSRAAPPPAPASSEVTHKVEWSLAVTSRDGQIDYTTDASFPLPATCQGMADMLNEQKGQWLRFHCVLTIKPPLVPKAAQSASAPVA